MNQDTVVKYVFYLDRYVKFLYENGIDEAMSRNNIENLSRFCFQLLNTDPNAKFKIDKNKKIILNDLADDEPIEMIIHGENNERISGIVFKSKLESYFNDGKFLTDPDSLIRF